METEGLTTRPAACLLCEARPVFFTMKDGYAFWRCTSCALLFLWPRLQRPPTQLYEADYFGGASAGFGYVDYDSEKKLQDGLFRGILKKIEALSGGKGELLDVGAATGHFVELAEREGWSACGIDVSEHGVAAGRKKGLRMKTASASDCAAAGMRFDAITMWDVIEHLPDPFEALRACAELLRPGGVLAAVTPDGGSAWARLFGARWHSIVPPEHVTLFSRVSLKKTLENAGFEVVDSKNPVKTFTLSYVISTAARWIGLALSPIQADRLRRSFLSKIVLPVPIGDNVLMLAKKK